MFSQPITKHIILILKFSIETSFVCLQMKRKLNLQMVSQTFITIKHLYFSFKKYFYVSVDKR